MGTGALAQIGEFMADQARPEVSPVRRLINFAYTKATDGGASLRAAHARQRQVHASSSCCASAIAVDHALRDVRMLKGVEVAPYLIHQGPCHHPAIAARRFYLFFGPTVSVLDLKRE